MKIREQLLSFGWTVLLFFRSCPLLWEKSRVWFSNTPRFLWTLPNLWHHSPRKWRINLKPYLVSAHFCPCPILFLPQKCWFPSIWKSKNSLTKFLFNWTALLRKFSKAPKVAQAKVWLQTETHVNIRKISFFSVILKEICHSTRYCDNFVPQLWVEFDDELSWLFDKRFRAFYIICRK